MTTHDSIRTILISGASAGIGRATAEQLLADGHRIIGIARDFGKCDIASPNFKAVEMDLGNIKALPDQLPELARQHPEVDAIINCAGQGRFGSLEEFSYKQIYKLMDLNFTSHAFVCRAFLPQLKQLSHSNIVFIGSEAALEGTQKGSIYCAGKFALRGFAQALRQECSGSGVHVSIVNPGMVKTGFFDQLNFSHGEDAANYIEVGDVAAAIKMILDSRPGTVVDEINLSPLKKVVSFKKDKE
jgi:3-hydroxy acid dehydrogenase/malonic semialdehyde reductase